MQPCPINKCTVLNMHPHSTIVKSKYRKLNHRKSRTTCITK